MILRRPNLGAMVEAFASRRAGLTAAGWRLVLGAAVAGSFGLGFAIGGQAKTVTTAAPSPIETTTLMQTPVVGAEGQIIPPIEGPVRGIDAYGSGAFGASRDGGRRTHRGVDLVAEPGAPVRAPIAGVVTRIGAVYAAPDALRFVEIASPGAGVKARVLYVGATVKLGGTVAAGELIGRAQNLAQRYPGGITNHVHLEIVDRRGGRLDPLAILQAWPQGDGPVA